MFRAIATIAVLVSAITPAVAKELTSMLPTEPQLITSVDRIGSCSETRAYLVGINFQNARSDPAIMRLATQARDRYAPGAPLLEAGSSDTWFRAIDIKDYKGLQRFLRSLEEPFDYVVTIATIPLEKRFSTAREQLDAWTEIDMGDVVGFGAEPCDGSR